MFKKNTALTGFGIGHFINTSTGLPVTTGSPVCKRILDGVAGSCENAASYNSTAGVWEIDLEAADMNANIIVLSFTLTSCLPICYTIRTSTSLISDLNDMAPAEVTTELTNYNVVSTTDLASEVNILRLDIEGLPTDEDVVAACDSAITANTLVIGIDAKTTNLPIDPADASELAALIAALPETSDVTTIYNLLQADIKVLQVGNAYEKHWYIKDTDTLIMKKSMLSVGGATITDEKVAVGQLVHTE